MRNKNKLLISWEDKINAKQHGNSGNSWLKKMFHVKAERISRKLWKKYNH